MSKRMRQTCYLCGKIITFALIGKFVPFGGVIVIALVLVTLTSERHVAVVRVSKRDMNKLRNAA